MDDESVDRKLYRPFCPLTCRLVDLGVWLDERCRATFHAHADVP